MWFVMKVLIKVALKLDYISKGWVSLHLEEKMGLTIRKTKMWFLTLVALLLEQLMSRKTFSIVGRRKLWNERWAVRLCRELWMGQTPVAVSPTWIRNNCF